MRITVVGLGHLGAVAAGGLATAGHKVTGVDVDYRLIDLLRAGKAPLHEPGLETWLRTAADKGDLRFIHRDEVAEPLGDVALIAAGTPSNVNGSADLLQVRSAIDWIKSRRPRNLVVAMKSTVPPGVGQTILQQDLKGLGVNYVANPEFIREGSALEDWQLPDRIVVGTEPGDERSVEVVREMYSAVNAPYLLTDITSAEMIKYASNGFLATRISFINEIASLCDRVGASVDAVSKGIAMDARTGSQIHAGIGYGGSCLPKDIRVLNRIALENGLDAPLLRSVVAVNDRQRLLPLEMLRRRFGETIAGLNVGVLGLAFKPGTNDVRDAPSLALIKALVNDGAMVRAFDPQANESAKGLLPSTVEFADSPAAASHGAQALVLLTEWADIVKADWKTIAKGMPYPKFVFDGRNALDPAVMVHLGFEYTGVGRGDAGTLNDGTRLAG